MARVYLIQQPREGFVFANVHSFGEVVTVLPLRSSSSLYPAENSKIIAEVMKDFDPEIDYVLDVTGDRLNGYLVSDFLAQELEVEKFMFLRWNRREETFSPVYVEFP